MPERATQTAGGSSRAEHDRADYPPVIPDLLEHRAMPEVANALRAVTPRIAEEWQRLVHRVIPSADRLTFEQIRDDLPIVLNMISDALSAANVEQARTLLRRSSQHGVQRFEQAYQERDLLIEYRLLRRVVIERVEAQLKRRLTTEEDLALDAAMDVAGHQVVLAFTRQQRDQIRAAAEAERDFLAFLSHDVRNNLGAITLTLRMLRERLRDSAEFALDVKDLDALSEIVDATVGGMSRLLQAETLRRGAAALSRQRVDLNRLCDNVALQFAKAARDKGLELAVNVPPGAEADSDGDLLTLVLQNLVGNAVKYSDRGRVLISAVPPRDTRHGEAAYSWLLTVADQGPGLPEHVKLGGARQAQSSDGSTPRGTGLGLAIASRAARLLGADLTARSQPGGGTTFQLLLPMRPPSIS